MSHTDILQLEKVSKRFVKKIDLATRLSNKLGALFNQEPVRDEVVHAVDCVSLKVKRGEVLALVGESGCGKSTLGRMALGLHTLSEGIRRWKGVDMTTLSAQQTKQSRLGMQMIFQDPYASLNPRLRIQDIVGEAPVVHGLIEQAEKASYVEHLLQQVGLAQGMQSRFVHQMSGGQRARVGIARALAVKPEFIVCDESVAALDVSIQAQVLNLFMTLRQKLQLTYLFISHDLSVVQHICDRVAIMYLGRIVEIASTTELFARPNHPYAIALLGAAPALSDGKKIFKPVQGEIPSPLNPPSGCHFHPRCPHANKRCQTEAPELKQIAPDRFSACHLNDSR